MCSKKGNTPIFRMPRPAVRLHLRIEIGSGNLLQPDNGLWGRVLLHKGPGWGEAEYGMRGGWTTGPAKTFFLWVAAKRGDSDRVEPKEGLEGIITS